MTPKQIVEAALRFTGPSRIPIGFVIADSWIDAAEGTDRERAELRQIIAEHPADLDDIGYAMVNPTLEPPRPLLPGEMLDEWGCIWSENAVIYHPLADWAALGSYTFPNPDATYHFEAIDAMRAQDPGRFLIGRAYSTLFERYRFLRGYQASLTDPYLEPDRSAELLRRIADFQSTIVAGWLARGADVIAFGDDYGMQDRLFMAPEVWRREYKPLLVELFDQARAGGAMIGLHADGNIEEILDDLVEMGLNLLNPVQKYAMDVERIGRRYGGRLSFHAGVNHQVTMPRGTAEEVAEEARWLIRSLSGPEGGFIAARGHVMTPDIPVRNALAMYRAYVEFSW